MLLEVFLNPEVICYLANTDQHSFEAWFCEWVASGLAGSTIDTFECDRAESRQELAKAVRLLDGDRPSETSPLIVSVYLKLRAGFPTLSQGLARYLHPVREAALAQYQTLRMNAQSASRLMKTEVSPADRMYARFGHTDIRELDLNMPVHREGQQTPV